MFQVTAPMFMFQASCYSSQIHVMSSCSSSCPQVLCPRPCSCTVRRSGCQIPCSMSSSRLCLCPVHVYAHVQFHVSVSCSMTMLWLCSCMISVYCPDISTSCTVSAHVQKHVIDYSSCLRFQPMSSGISSCSVPDINFVHDIRS